MHPIGLVFTLFASIFLLILPRRLAAVPLLLGAAYMTRGQELEIGPAHFTVVRILVTVGFLRVLLKREHIANGMNNLDRWLILWTVLLIASSAFHTSDAWVFRIGLVWSEMGCYFLFRIFIQDWEDVRHIFKILCVALIPLAALMLLEKAIGKNFFAFLGGVWEVPIMRNGHFRAQGPFANYILAGTVGASCFPMAIYLWKSNIKHALMGLFAGGGIIFACTSSGPIMMLLFILFGLVLWKARNYLAAIRWLSLTAVLALDAIMKDPVYFLMARIDLSGGSQGWFRARLIQSSIEHLDEWWLAGTDYTRHWMASGQHGNDNHTDIVNHFLSMGVMGGLPLMFLFIIVLVTAFHMLGRALQENESASMKYRFLIWTLGAILFGHIGNFFSVALYDQSVVFFYLILASIAAVHVTKSFAVVKHIDSVNCIKQSRYVTVGVNKAKEEIEQQSTLFYWDTNQRVNPSVKIFWRRQSSPLLINSCADLPLARTALAQSHAKYRTHDSSFS
jgi:hypothetical protein